MAEGEEQGKKPWADPKEIAELDKRVRELEEKPVRVEVPADLNAVEVTYTSNGTANTRDPVTHNLKRTPRGYLVIGQDAAGSVYEDKGVPWTAEKMYLKCSAASVKLRLLVF